METTPRILVVDDERSMREMVAIMLRRHGFEVEIVNSGRVAIAKLDAGARFDIVVSDLLMDGPGGLDVLSRVKELDPGCEVVLITAYGTAETAVEAMKRGAYDYLSKPFNIDEFLLVLRGALERQSLIRENDRLRDRVAGRFRFNDVVGKSRAMQEVIALARKVADSQATVLVSGESGTGKEVVARSIHFGGARAAQPFIAVNCGALPEPLMESELFGHVRGAFTGAVGEKDGLFRAAKAGTLFLDEIGELPLQLQVKLLRALQERQIRPVGGQEEHPFEARLVAATNRELAELVEKGAFRTDLFYRLNVIQIVIPPLRERREDIAPLAERLLDRIAAELGQGAAKTLTPAAVRALLSYDYPGNVRELANILERAATLSETSRIDEGDLTFGPERHSRPAPAPGPLARQGFSLESALEAYERQIIEQALQQTGGNRTQAAARLGVTFRSLRYRLQKLGLGDDETDPVED